MNLSTWARSLQQLSILAPPLVFAVVLHEVSHGWVADRRGDHTARLLGRLTLNPLVHIDPLGTILLPLLTYLASNGAMIFGAAKPVPVNAANLRSPARDMFWVALAGPGVNLGAAALSGLLLRGAEAVLSTAQTTPAIGGGPADLVLVPVLLMLQYSVRINVLLCLFNLIPIPPLDGGRVAVAVLPSRPALALSRVEPYGFLIIFGLFLFDAQLGLLRTFLWPLVHLMTRVFLGANF